MESGPLRYECSWLTEATPPPCCTARGRAELLASPTVPLIPCPQLLFWMMLMVSGMERHYTPAELQAKKEAAAAKAAAKRRGSKSVPASSPSAILAARTADPAAQTEPKVPGAVEAEASMPSASFPEAFLEQKAAER